MGAERLTLGDFLSANLARPREPGQWDCCTMPAAWAMQCGAVDPMADLRGTYATEAEGVALCEAAGGLAALAGPRLEAVGWNRQESPAVGDIGCGHFAGVDALLVFTGGRWAFVADRGLGFVSLPSGRIAAIWGLR